MLAKARFIQKRKAEIMEAFKENQQSYKKHLCSLLVKTQVMSKLIVCVLQLYNDGFISTSNTCSEQKEQTNREKYAFYCSVSENHINPEKT